ncbi:MAG: peptidoglycan-binding protein [bacterium]|nr:peptidoglycan-binding protein [bacterium]
MNKTIHLQRNMLRTRLLLGGAMVAMLVFSLLGIQSAYAAINSQLDFGDRGSEVTQLQTYLATNVNIYPEGLVTGYFGQLTKAAVERFQTAQGIISQGTPATTGYGRVGPMTRAAINAILAGTGIPSADVYAPTIKSVNVTTNNSSASVTWTASEASMGKVYYRTLPIRISNTFDVTGVFSGEPVVTGTLAHYDGIARATHTININDLTPDTTYHYLVVVFDSSKNVSITTPATFRTTQ